MKVKNYLVLKNYNITDQFFVFNQMDKVRERYVQMQNIMMESAQLFLKDLDAIIIDRDTVPHDQYMFKHHMQLIDDRYHSEPCNILYCDLDVLFVRPVEIFGKFDQFSMLSHQCGIRYYPHGGVPEEVWEIQRSGMQNWDETLGPENGFHNDDLYKWDREQDIYASMMGHVMDASDEALEQAEEFSRYIHTVYNDFPEHDIAAMVHYNGTGQLFDPVDLGHRLLNLAKMGNYQAIRRTLNRELYRVWTPRSHEE